MKRVVTSIFLFIAVLSIFSCGGSSGGGSSAVNGKNVNLGALTLSAGSISFNPEVVTYAVEVPSGTASLNVQAKPSDAASIVSINGTNCGERNIALAFGANTIAVSVTADDNSATKVYIITATRIDSISHNAGLSGLDISSGVLSPSFNKDTTIYTSEVPHETQSLAIKPTAGGNGAAIKINGTSTQSGTQQSFTLHDGANIFSIEVLAEDMLTSKTYHLVTYRVASSANANLASLTISNGSVISPAIDKNITRYTAEVPYTVESVTVTPSSSGVFSTVSVNGVDVQAGGASESIPLSVGSNSVMIRVTAQDGTMKDYYLIITRQSGETNSYLTGITLSSGTLQPVFDKDTLTYTAVVDKSVSAVSVTATTAGAYAGLSINGTAAISGVASSPINRDDVDITIPVVVTPQVGPARLYSLKIYHIGPFGNNGLVVQQSSTDSSNGRSIIMDEMGRILVSGYNGASSTDGGITIWRFNPNGDPDTSFGQNGKVTYVNPTGWYSESGYSMAIDSNKRIIVTGQVSDGAGNEYMAIWRYNENGTPDTTFGNNGFVSYAGSASLKRGSGLSVIVDSNNKIVVTGEIYQSSIEQMAIWRYSSTGILDTSFGGGDGLVISAGIGRHLIADTNNNYIITGRSNGKMTVWKYTSIGVLDTSFGGGDGVYTYNTSSQGNKIVADSIGRLFITGWQTTVDKEDMAIWCLNSAGVPDTVFGGGSGIVIHNNAAGGNGADWGASIALDSHGRIFVTGTSERPTIWAGSSGKTLARGIVVWCYTLNGNLDTTFEDNGISVKSGFPGNNGLDSGNSIMCCQDGRVFVTGYSYSVVNSHTSMFILCY